MARPPPPPKVTAPRGALGPLPDFSHADLEKTAAAADGAGPPHLDDLALARLTRKAEGRLRRAYLATHGAAAAAAARVNAVTLAGVVAARRASAGAGGLLPASAAVLDLSTGGSGAADPGGGPSLHDAFMIVNAQLTQATLGTPGLGTLPRLAGLRVRTAWVPPAPRKGPPNPPKRGGRVVPAIIAPAVAPIPPYMTWAYLLRNEVAIDVGRAVYYTDPAGETIAASESDQEGEDEDDGDGGNGGGGGGGSASSSSSSSSYSSDEEEEGEDQDGDRRRPDTGNTNTPRSKGPAAAPGGGKRGLGAAGAAGAAAAPAQQPFPRKRHPRKPAKREPAGKLDSVWREGEEWVLARAAAGPLGGGPRAAAALAESMRLPPAAVARRTAAAAAAAAAARAALAASPATLMGCGGGGGEGSAGGGGGGWEALPLPPFPLLPAALAHRLVRSAVAAATAAGTAAAPPPHPDTADLAPAMCRMCRRFACLPHGTLAATDALHGGGSGGSGGSSGGSACPTQEDAPPPPLPPPPPPPPPPRLPATSRGAGCGRWCARPGAPWAAAARAAAAADATATLPPGTATTLAALVHVMGPDPCALGAILPPMVTASGRRHHRCAAAAAWLEGQGLAPAPVAGWRGAAGAASVTAGAAAAATAVQAAYPPFSPTSPSPATAAARSHPFVNLTPRTAADAAAAAVAAAAAAAKAQAAAEAARAKRGALKIAQKRKRELLGPLWPAYTPCDCVGGCDPATCPCHGNSNYCEKFCGCAHKAGGAACVYRFQGCQCAGGCATKACPCLAAGRECDPDLCLKCVDREEAGAEGARAAARAAAAAAARAAAAAAAAPPPALVAAGLVPSDAIACANGRVRRGEHKRLAVGLSAIIGWGAYAVEPVAKGDLLGEYTGDLITQEEANRRGKAYDRDDNSYLFDLTLATVVDARRRGNKLRFVNHDAANPNCRPEIRLVDGEARIGLFAAKEIPVGGELVFDYGYAQDNWEGVE